jgi:hypothetical protein
MGAAAAPTNDALVAALLLRGPLAAALGKKALIGQVIGPLGPSGAYPSALIA